MEENNEYIVTINSGLRGATTLPLAEDYCFMFTTQYDPLYTSVEILRTTLGILIKDVPDDTLNRIITYNTRKALEIYPKDVTVTGVQWYMIEYVRCKSSLEPQTGE